ncbi:hypothetical protein [Rhodanobacter sp. L36]|uniref:hypothetical protein n=1 Tax=Rhodanobacter sp. L36 TaxID=1747221 RepID=UPI00131C57CF|nr:hypothetical protein [Rhodanobacter sp. L36]
MVQPEVGSSMADRSSLRPLEKTEAAIESASSEMKTIIARGQGYVASARFQSQPRKTQV